MALTQISTGGIKDDAVTDAKLPANSVGNSEMKDDAVGVAELSATGTAGNTTYLRGDNTWATPPDTDTNTQLSTEEVQDIVGAMFTGNTETNITATYEDGDGTIDLVASAGVGGATGVDFNDDTKIRLGTGNDLEIYHLSDVNIINATAGTLSLRHDNEMMLQCVPDGTVELYYDGVLKFKTVSGGVRTAGNLELLDDHEIQLGSGTDLKIYHKSSDNGNYIECENSRTLYYQSDLHAMLDEAGNEYIIKGTANGAVELYHNNAKKLETSADGITMSGWIYIPDSDGTDNMLRFGNGADLKIYHDASHSYIDNTGTGNLYLKDAGAVKVRTASFGVDNADGSEAMIAAAADGSVDLYYDNNCKFKTASYGTLQNNGNYRLMDSDSSDPGWARIQWGQSQDLQIYHEGTNSIIETNSSATKSLHIKGDPIWFYKTGTSELFCKMVADSGVELYHDGTKKLETISTGVNITGGIRLGGNNAANELDDYETGDWTATFEGHNTAGSFSFGSGYGTGKYTKIGNLVTFTIYTGNMTISGTDGVAKITGLPFTSAAGNRLHNMFSVTHATCFDHNCSGGYVNPGATYGYFMRGFDTTSSNSWAGGGYLMISGTYQTD